MMKVEHYRIPPKNLLPFCLWLEPRTLRFQNGVFFNLPQNCKCTGIICSIPHKPCRCSPMRSFTTFVSLNHGASSLSEEDQISNDNVASEGASANDLPQKLRTDELRSLLLDSERSRLLKKLSEANQYNRFLKRQLQIKDDALVSLRNELAVLELESQALVNIAEEVANSVVQPGSRKINGKYIQSHLLSRLQAVHKRLKEKIKDVSSLKFEEVALIWVGMAESVQVMGSFDGWSQGEEMSPEYSGGYSRFSATLKLRPGRYEVKFLVDGEWLLSPELPTVGEGMLKNNLLIVE